LATTTAGRPAAAEGMTLVSSTRRVSALGVLVIAVAVAGCGSGRSPEVVKERSAINGTNAVLGSVHVDNVYASPTDPLARAVQAGQDLDIHMVLVNDGKTAAGLTGLTETAGAAAELGPNPSAFTIAPGRIVHVGAAGGPTATLKASKSIFVGENLRITLLFADGASLPLTIPVEPPPSV
jgi:hypothetical protein